MEQEEEYLNISSTKNCMPVGFKKLLKPAQEETKFNKKKIFWRKLIQIKNFFQKRQRT